mgnify:CR=1 FL=1
MDAGISKVGVLGCGLMGGSFAMALRQRGLVQEVVETGSQVNRALELARIIAANAPIAVRETKANAYLALEQGESAAVADMSRVRRAFMASDDLREGVASFVERRDARFTGR